MEDGTVGLAGTAHNTWVLSMADTEMPPQGMLAAGTSCCQLLRVCPAFLAHLTWPTAFQGSCVSGEGPAISAHHRVAVLAAKLPTRLAEALWVT